MVKHWLQRKEISKHEHLLMTSKAFLFWPYPILQPCNAQMSGVQPYWHIFGLLSMEEVELNTKPLTANVSGIWSEKTHVFSITLAKFSICPLFKQMWKLPVWGLWFPQASRNPVLYSVGLLGILEIICWGICPIRVRSWNPAAELTCPVMCSHRK